MEMDESKGRPTIEGPIVSAFEQPTVGRIEQLTESKTPLKMDCMKPLGGNYDPVSEKERIDILLTAVRKSSLPTAAKERKEYPIASGVLDYFPDALAEVAHVSFVGNQQHNPGQPLHWDKTKSMDHADALMRHLSERGTNDSDGVRHSAKVAWRALALLQIEIEKERGESK